MPINDSELTELKERARAARRSTVMMTSKAGAGHLGGSLSVTDILIYLYFHAIRHRPHPERDRLYLSAGHLCPALYAVLAEFGTINKNKLGTYGQMGSKLQGHPSLADLPAVETASGSLGQGLSIALGAALAVKLDGGKNNIYCVMSDGEQEEGSVWEAAMAAAHYLANNLIAIIDRNKLQISGSTENVIGLAPLGAKYRAFGWHVIECDGHDFLSIDNGVCEARGSSKPSVIIAHTVMGKGIKSIENDSYWHGKVLDNNKLSSALKELQ